MHAELEKIGQLKLSQLLPLTMLPMQFPWLKR